MVSVHASDEDFRRGGIPRRHCMHPVAKLEDTCRQQSSEQNWGGTVQPVLARCTYSSLRCRPKMRQASLCTYTSLLLLSKVGLGKVNHTHGCPIPNEGDGLWIPSMFDTDVREMILTMFYALPTTHCLDLAHTFHDPALDRHTCKAVLVGHLKCSGSPGLDWLVWSQG